MSFEDPRERFIAAQGRLLQETGSGARSRFLEIAAPAAAVRRAHVIETGRPDAPPVVMIHGGNSVAAGLEPLLGLLRDDLRISAPDRPGCGLTDQVDYHTISNFREHAVAFVGSILDGLGLERVSLVGNSVAGYWALVYALAHPERVERLVLLGEPAGSARHPSFRHRLLATPGVNRLLYATALKPRRERTRAQLGAVVAHPERVSEAFLDLAFAAATLPGAQRAWLSMVETINPPTTRPRLTFALRPELGRIQQPALFVWGDRDGCPPSWGADLAALIPNARLDVIPGAGHLPWLDEPERVAGLLRAFLTGPASHTSVATDQRQVERQHT